jgi:hypothetical protein
MRIIPTRVHGMLDYLMGVVLMIAPWLLGLRAGPETWVPVALGAGALVYSLLTRYELGLYGLIPMPVHLALDAVSGLFLMASPWLFGFADHAWVPHVVFGALELGAAAMTRTVPERAARGSLAV